MPAEQLTPEQEHLREVTAKWQFQKCCSHRGIDLKWEDMSFEIQDDYRDSAASLLAIQQAAGARLLVNSTRECANEDGVIRKYHQVKV